jgi:hypothetical protein
MDLTKKYMEGQGTLGYLHTRPIEHAVTLAYFEDEGAEPRYYHTDADEADATLERWAATGDFAIKEVDWTGPAFMRERIVQAVRVVKMIPENSYYRRMYPQEHKE